MEHPKRVVASRRGTSAGTLLGLAVTLLVPSLGAATVQGRIIQCSGTVAAPVGYRVAAFQAMLVGSRSIDGGCEGPFTLDIQVLGSTRTVADGTFSIDIDPTRVTPPPNPPKCFSENKVFIEVSTSTGMFLRRSDGHDLANRIDIGDLDTGDCRICTLSFEGPSFVSGQPGQQVTFEAYARLDPHSLGPTLEGWHVLAAADGCTIIGADTRNTAAATTEDVPPGLFHPSFSTVGINVEPAESPSDPGCFGGPLAFSLAIINNTAVVGLPAAGSPHRILRLTLRAVIPQGASSCRLRFQDGCKLESAPPTLSNACFESALRHEPPQTSDLVIELRPQQFTPPFRRADANASGLVDIFDAIATFGYLFLGHATPPCLSAADSNGDGTVDISDGVNTLGFLFGGSRAFVIPFPGAQDCGGEPVTETSLGCEDYGICD